MLCSRNHKTRWPFNKALTAECLMDIPHEAPHRNCHCGIYAAKDIGTVWEGYINRMFCHGLSAIPEVFGLVSLWGTVIEYTSGYRAQYAYPHLLVMLSPPRWADSYFARAEWKLGRLLRAPYTVDMPCLGPPEMTAAALSDYYGVPVLMMQVPNDPTESLRMTNVFNRIIALTEAINQGRDLDTIVNDQRLQIFR